MNSTKKRKNLDKSEILCVLVIMALCLLPRLVLCMHAYPMRTKLDELATMGGAAYFAGLDWSGVMSQASYYGTGFTGLFSFIFSLTDNPLTIYRFFVSMAAVLQALTGFICYRIMSRFLGVRSKAVLVLTSVMSSYMVVTRAVIVYNEHMLIFLTWVIIYLLLYMNYYEDKKKKRISTFILALVLGYAYTIHTRAVIFVIILLILTVLAYLYKRIKIIDIPTFAITGIIGITIAQCYVKWVQKAVWVLGEGETLINSTIAVGGNTFKQLLELESWKAIFYTVIGQISTITKVSGGVLLLMFFVTIGLVWRGRKRKDKRDKYFTLILIVLVYCFGCIAITIAGQSITWLGGVREVLDAGYESNLYGSKAFTYIRYFGPFCGPLVMIFGVLADKWRRVLRRNILPTIIGALVLELVWLLLQVPYIVNTTTNRGWSEALICFAWSDRHADYDYAFFFTVTIVALVFTLAVMLLIRYNKKKILLLAVTGLLLYQYIYNAWVWDIHNVQKNGYAMADAAYDIMKQLEQEIELPESIYVVPTDSDIFQYQFMLNRYKILPGMSGEEAMEENVIVFTRTQQEEIPEGFTWFQLEKKEHMYVKGEELTQTIAGILAE